MHQEIHNQNKTQGFGSFLEFNLNKFNYEVIPMGLRSTMQPYIKNIYSMQTKIISDHPLE